MWLLSYRFPVQGSRCSIAGWPMRMCSRPFCSLIQPRASISVPRQSSGRLMEILLPVGVSDTQCEPRAHVQIHIFLAASDMGHPAAHKMEAGVRRWPAIRQEAVWNRQDPQMPRRAVRAVDSASNSRRIWLTFGGMAIADASPSLRRYFLHLGAVRQLQVREPAAVMVALFFLQHQLHTLDPGPTHAAGRARRRPAVRPVCLVCRIPGH